MKALQVSRARRVDTVARWMISAAGISLLALTIIMVVFMFRLSIPLFSKGDFELVTSFTHPSRDAAVLVGLDPDLERAYVITESGRLTLFSLPGGKPLESRALEVVTAGACIVKVDRQDSRHYLYWDDGNVSYLDISFERRINPMGVSEVACLLAQHFMSSTQTKPGELKLVRRHDDQTLLVYETNPRNLELIYLDDGGLETKRQTIETGMDGDLKVLTASSNGESLFAGSNLGELTAWDLSTENPYAYEPVIAKGEATAITALAMMNGDQTLLVGNEAGLLSGWNKISGRLVKLHDFVQHPGPVRALSPSSNRIFFSAGTGGVLVAHQMTTERTLLKIPVQSPPPIFAVSENNSGLLTRRPNGNFSFFQLNFPHPEISWSVLWGKTRYEGSEEPVYDWKPMAGEKNNEPRYSLVPLVFGSLKGALLALLFSFPLAFLAALYVSHMMHPSWRGATKSVIELMAAAPTVVIGVFAAVWLAPVLEHNLLALLMAVGCLPLVFTIGMVALFRRRKKPIGVEFLWGAPLLLIGSWCAWRLGLSIQDTAFGGHFNFWLSSELGWTMTQQNGVIVAFALGFAVTPIIFTLCEDALSNAPITMTAAALALGSSRWQTVRRIVLPLAGPGVIAAVMIGFARALGETMIVLLVTGNKPIISANIFDGMRTLSANIALEAGAADPGSAMYRLLFFAALLLFGFTFIINTIGELMRRRLKHRYGATEQMRFDL